MLYCCAGRRRGAAELGVRPQSGRVPAALGIPSPAPSVGDPLPARPSSSPPSLFIYDGRRSTRRMLRPLRFSRHPSPGPGWTRWWAVPPGSGAGPRLRAGALGYPPPRTAGLLKASRACAEVACQLGVFPTRVPHWYTHGGRVGVSAGGCVHVHAAACVGGLCMGACLRYARSRVSAGSRIAACVRAPGRAFLQQTPWSLAERRSRP